MQPNTMKTLRVRMLIGSLRMSGINNFTWQNDKESSVNVGDAVVINLVINNRKRAKERPNIISMSFKQLGQEATTLHPQGSSKRNIDACPVNWGEMEKVFGCQSQLGTGHSPELTWPWQAHGELRYLMS